MDILAEGAKVGTTRQVVERKSKEKIYGSCERGHELRREGSR